MAMPSAALINEMRFEPTGRTLTFRQGKDGRWLPEPNWRPSEAQAREIAAFRERLEAIKGG